jgi:hypothetical protein
MSTPTLQTGLTARTFLLGGGNEDDSAVLGRSLYEHGVIGSGGAAPARLTGEAGEAVNQELASVAVGLLDVDLGDLLIYGWRTHRRLLDAAKATLRAPGSEEVVRLGSHRISSAQHPTVDLLIDDVCVHTLQFDLMMIFDIDVAVAVIRDGNLVALKYGNGSVTGRLSVDNIELAHRQRRINLELIIHLRQGVPLLHS